MWRVFVPLLLLLSLILFVRSGCCPLLLSLASESALQNAAIMYDNENSIGAQINTSMIGNSFSSMNGILSSKLSDQCFPSNEMETLNVPPSSCGRLHLIVLFSYDNMPCLILCSTLQNELNG